MSAKVLCIGLAGTSFLAAQSSQLTFRMENSGELREVFYEDGRYFAATREFFLTSEDGRTWTGTQDVASTFQSMAYDGTTFVAVPNLPKIFNSTDGISWEQVSLEGFPGRGDSYYAVAHGAGRFVAVGERFGLIVHSTDGLTWSAATSSNISPLEDVVFTNGRFVAIAENHTVVTSTDGVTWTSRPAIFDPQIASDQPKLATFGNRFVAISFDEIAYSDDGISWTKRTTPEVFGQHVAMNASTTVVVGAAAGLGGVVMTSTDDGQNWSIQSLPGTDSLTGVTYGDEGFVVVEAKGEIYRSDDGFTWEKVLNSTPGNSPLGNPDVEPLIVIDGQYILLAGELPVVSTDATSWETVEIEATETRIRINNVVFTGGKYFAMGENQFMASGDRLDRMVQRPLPGAGDINPTDVEFGDGRYYAVANNATAGYVSDDGVTWENFTYPANARNGRLHSLIYGGGRFLAYGGTGQSWLTKADGEEWRQTVGLSEHFTSSVAKMEYIDGQFVAVSRGAVWTSPSDLNWQRRFEPPEALQSMSYEPSSGTYSFSSTSEIPQAIYTTQSIPLISDTPSDIVWTRFDTNPLPRSGGITVDRGNFVFLNRDGYIAFATMRTAFEPELVVQSPSAARLFWNNIGVEGEVWATTTLNNDWARIDNAESELGGFRFSIDIPIGPQQPKRFFEIRPAR